MHNPNINLCIVACVAIVGVVIVICVAMSNNIDGIALAAAIGAIVGIPTAIITRKFTKSKSE